jgi:hypothetical protein
MGESIMKSLGLVFTIMFLAFFTGCVPSLHPLYTQDDLVFEPGLVGKWSPMEEGEEGEVWRFVKAGESGYRLIIEPKEEKKDSQEDRPAQRAEFDARLLKLGDHMFLDLYPEQPKFENDFYMMHLVPAHSFFKISIEGDILKLVMLDYDWLEKMLEKRKIKLKHERLEDGPIVLTASTKELQKFFKKYADNRDAFQNPGLMRRIKETKFTP